MKKIEISPIQEQFWILQNLYPDTSAYNIPSVLRVEGKLNIDALQNAIEQVVLRYEMLRVRFVEENDKVYQNILSANQTKMKIEIIDVDEPYTNDLLPKQIMEEVNRPFELSVWPLFRIKIFIFNDEISILTIVFHHIIIDLFSLQVFARDLSDFYNSYSFGFNPPSNYSLSNYSDYTVKLKKWLNTEKGRKKVEEWKEDIPQMSDLPDFSTEFGRPKINNLEGKRKFFFLDSVTSHKIKEFADRNSINDFTVLLTAYAILLNKLSNQTKIIIGVPFANRKSREFRETFGCFVNILPICVDFAKDMTGEGLLMQVFQSLLNAHRKQEVPFLLLNSILSKNDGTSLLQVGFTMEPPMELHLKGIDVIPLVVEREGSQLDLFLTLWSNDERYNAYLQYSSDCFNTETIKHIWKIYCTAINSLIENPYLFINEIDLTPEEDLQFIYELNRTEIEYEDNICIHQKFEQQVEKTPDNQAILFNDHALSYRELNDQSNRIANRLIRAGIKVEDIVGICIGRSIEMMAGIFGILKAGAAYLPLSPETPAERLKSIVTDANPKIILTNKSSSSNIPHGIPIWNLDDILKNPLPEDSTTPNVKVSSKNLAYIIYTSGSTGIPKGVMIEHHSVLNRLGWMQKTYPIDMTDTLLQKTPITFDVSVWELFWWSFYGSKLVLLPEGGEKDPETILQHIDKYGVSTIHFVPSMFVAFFESLKARKLFDRLNSLNRIFLSGEALPLKLVKEFNEMRAVYLLPDLINLYGPTEATVDVSYFNCPKSEVNNIYIGRPIDNTKLFVINSKNKVQPIGIPGELIITGVNLARGYLNHPELTNQKFFDFRISEDKIVKAYRTGDLVKLTQEGEIDFIGRLDNQVKIRGFRIELGDIESKILEHPEVSNCAVVVSENSDLKSLIAYICLKSGTDIRKDILRKYLSEKLPDYMVPSHFVFLETLPLTSNGKIDRKNLPEPVRNRTNDIIVLPISSIEEGLLEVWKNLLEMELISITDNFFDIGGNSLLAIRLINKIREELGFSLTFGALIANSTIKQLGVLIENRARTSEKVIELIHLTKTTNLPLTKNQKRLWLISKLQPSVPSYIIPFTYHLVGYLDRDVFKKSLEILFQRHHIVFSVIKEVDGEPYCDIVLSEVNLAFFDYSGLPENEKEKKVNEILNSDSEKAFDLRTGPLFRLYLIMISSNEYYFHFSIHHIIFDGWSWGVFVKDLNIIYNNLLRGKAIDLEKVEFQQYDYAHWENSYSNFSIENELIEFWKDNLKESSPILNFPYDFQRRSQPTGKGGYEVIRFSQELSDKLREISKEEGISLFSTMLSTFGIQIHKYSGEDDINIGLPVASRSHSKLENVFGMFVNTIVVRLKFNKELTFRKLIHQTDQVALNAIAHKELPFETIVEIVNPERFPSVNPIFQIGFVWQNNLNVPLKLDGIRSIKVSEKLRTTPFDITIYLWESEGIIEGEIEYSTDLLKHETILQFRNNFLNLVNNLVENSDAALESLPLITDEEKVKIDGFNNTHIDYPKDKTIIQLFEEQVSIYPDKTALVFKEESLTYKQLNYKANQLANNLIKVGVGRNTPVGILAEKSLAVIVGILGILKAGGVYVPIDPDYPSMRINFIIKDSGCKVLLVQDKSMSIYLDNVTRLNLNNPGSYAEEISNPKTINKSSDLAYIMYTSGTTGVPKGSLIPQHGVVRLVRNTNYIEITSADRILLTGAMVFDATTFEIWGALLNGGTLYIEEKETILDPKTLGEELQKNNITILWLSSSLFTQISESHSDIFSKLKYLLVGGDVLSTSHINRVRKDNPKLKVINGYGPTENTTFSTTYLIDRDFENNIPIGKPVSNSTAYIFDSNMNYQPIGVIGELYVGGDGLSMGYLNREDLNKTSYIANPHNPAERLYRTGDRAKWLPDGNIEFHGRVDNQFKIRGFRVELEEIESVISEIDGIIETVVKPAKVEVGDYMLVAFLNVPESSYMDPKEIGRLIKAKLPSYMVPSAYKFMHGFPKTINGKIDRKSRIFDVKEPEFRKIVEIKTLTPTENIIHKFWSEALKTEEISITDNFFEIGGNSLLAISVFSKIESAFNLEWGLRVFFDSPRIKDLAEAIDIALQNKVKNISANKTTLSNPKIIEGEI